MKFQILIPTYNRSADLQENLRYLKNQLQKYELTNDFGIVVSDNASTDDTRSMLQTIKKEWDHEISLEIIYNDTNVGLEQNAVNLLKIATGDYIIWLGDDDFLADGYLDFIKQRFAGDNIGWMIPGLIGVDKDGNRHIGRPVNFPYKNFPAGYDTVFECSHLAHQMSGLVVKREGLYDKYMAKPEWRNPYLFIFFTAICQMIYKGIYAPSYQAIINNYNPKDWGYNRIGLLDEVFKSYYYLKPDIGNNRLNKLLLRFILMHSYRIDFDKGLAHVLRQGSWISKSVIETKGLTLPLFNLLIKEYVARKLRKG